MDNKSEEQGFLGEYDNKQEQMKKVEHMCPIIQIDVLNYRLVSKKRASKIYFLLEMFFYVD